MGIVETSIVYGILGLVMAVAMVLRQEGLGGAKLFGLFILGALFWPLLAPTVLARSGKSSPPEGGPCPGAGFEAPARIRAAEERLLSALAKVKGGVAEDVLAPEVARVRALGGSLGAMARRLREIDELLGSPELDEHGGQAALADLEARGHGGDDPRVVSVRARLRNIDRLREMRARTSDDLERALLKIEEMASQMLLLKFAGKPDAEVVGLIKDIADSVGSITDALLEAA
jgi:hypothetical protein